MGVFYNSICLPGRFPEEVGQRLDRWLGARGFERSEGPVLFDLDDLDERSAYLVSGDRWTVLFFSSYEEDRRLIHELGALAVPILYLWVHDSDVWGWDVFREGGIEASFSSDPRHEGPFEGLPFDSPERPAAEPLELCRLLGLDPGIAGSLARVHGRRGAFQEEVCREFADLLGVAPAAASYEDLERGALDSSSGWSCEHLFYVRSGADPAPPIDIHAHRITRWIPSPHTRPESTQLEISPELLREMARMRRRLRLTLIWLRPLSWLSRTWRRGVEAASRLRWALRERIAVRRPPATATESYRREGRRLINDRHRCRIELPPRVEPAPAPSRPPLVFAFAVRKVTVTCTARRLRQLDEVLRRPSRSQVLSDEKYKVRGHKVRHVLFELPPQFIAGGKEPAFLGMHVVQTEAALYVFLYRHTSRPQEVVEAAIRQTVESFRIE